jgi:hypothetical protein
MHSGWFAFFVLLPLWAAGGFGDYLCHRASRISRTTAGTQESALHLLQWFEVAMPVFLVLAFGVRAWTVAVGAAFVVAHGLTAWWDERTARPQRFISIAENHCHAFLSSVPAVAWGLAASSLAFGEPERPLPAWVPVVVIAVFAGSGVLIVEELVRCWRSGPHRHAR